MRSKLYVPILMLIGMGAIGGAAIAANTNVLFTGTVLSPCVLTVGTSGVLAPSGRLY